MFTVEHVPSHTVKQLSSSLNKIDHLYARDVFTIHVILMDMELKKVQDELGLVLVNMMAACEHVREIKHGIEIIKERFRSVMSDLPPKILHKQIVIHLIYFCVTGLNAMPEEQGISHKVSPREIITNHKMDFNKDCKAIFGSYIEASEYVYVTNNM